MNENFRTRQILVFMLIIVNSVLLLAILAIIGMEFFGEESTTGLVDSPVPIPEDFLISSVVYQDLLKDSAAFDFSIEDSVSQYSYNSCWNYGDPEYSDVGFEEASKPVTFWGSGSSGENAVVSLYCDRNMSEVNQITVASNPMLDILFSDDGDFLQMDKSSGGSELKEGDSISMYMKKMYLYGDDRKVLVGDVPLYFSGDVDGEHTEVRIPSSMYIDKQYFPDMEYSNSTFAEMDYKFGMVCAIEGCTEALFPK